MNIELTLGSSISFWLREHDGNGAMVSASGVASGVKDYASDNEYTCMTSLSWNASHKIDIHDTMNGGCIGGAGCVAMALNDATQNFAIDTFSLQRSNAGGTAKK